MLKKLILTVSLYFFIGLSVSTANDYTLPEIKIDVEILYDGTVRFTEH